jgi:hypothetical protein
MIDEIQPVGPSGLLNLIEAMKRGIPVGPAATGSDDNPSKQALADIQYPAAQGATPNLQAAPFGSLAPMAPQQPGAPAASIPLPRPRPAIPAASQALPPAVASAQASAPLARLQPINYAKLNNSGCTFDGYEDGPAATACFAKQIFQRPHTKCFASQIFQRPPPIHHTACFARQSIS